MKTAFVFLFLGIGLLALLYAGSKVYFSASTIDIHISDTYYILEKPTALIAVSLFLSTLFSLGGLLGTRFRSRFFIFLFIICAIATALIAWQVLNT